MRRIGSLVLAMVIGSAAQAQVPPTAQIENRTLPGLRAPGEIVIDHHGIPHIRAASARDGFFLQGYAAARDRLWQIDLWRKRGLGRLSASLGPGYVAQDRAARLFLYRGDMAAEWAAYPPSAKEWTEAFVAGINAFIADARAGRQPMPVEFAATGSAPETWSAEDVVRIRSNALTANVPSEVARARALCKGDARLEPLRRQLDPPRAIAVPVGLDPCSIPANVLSDYVLGIGEVRFDGKRPELVGPEGSNNWVIAPSRSATGRPILANDPHRAHAVPSLRYVSHIDTPELKLAGAGEPALPGISFGHNGQVAWALTIFGTDQQDLVVHPKGARFTEVTESIPVKGEAPRSVRLRFDGDEPVIHEDAASGRAFTLRATWSRPGASAYFGASWAWTAKSWQDFLVTRNRWGAPAVNLLFAGSDGDIGWAPTGFVPVRAAGDGLLPVPAGIAHRWTGMLDPASLPLSHNPTRGWLATANEMNLPAGYPHLLSHEWADRSRANRIGEVIAAKPKFSLVDAMALQTDTVSDNARRMMKMLAELQGRDANERAALALLKGWDGNETAASPQALLYQFWASRTLGPATVQALVPEAARAGFGKASVSNIIPVLEDGILLGKDPTSMRARILLGSLGIAYAQLVREKGDASKWRWGDALRAQFAPALTLPDRGEGRVVGPLGVGGSGSSPGAAFYVRGFHLAGGASVRLVIDVGAWDNAMVINTPGQSGNATDPHYRDLFPLWAAGKFVPFRWSREAVDAVAGRVIRATP